MNDGKGHVATPDLYGMPYKEVTLTTIDNEQLHSYVSIHPDGSATKTVVILCPNAGNIGHSLPIAQIFYETFGYNVFIYSYRGYGKSSGESNEIGLKKDADCAMEFILNHEILNKTSIILYGRSLGGAVAIYIGSKNYKIVKGMILENTFLSIRKTIPHIFPILSNFTRLCHQIWNSEADITKINSEVPMLFISAGQDEIVPPSHMKTLYGLSHSTIKEFKFYQDAHHNDTVLGPDYWHTVQRFIRSSVEPLET